MTRHKVFVSYQHVYPDQQYRDQFEHAFAQHSDVFISESVQIGDIAPKLATDTVRQKIRDEYLRDSTVTVVLVGPTTWQRKHVDWEISSSLRQTTHSSRSGLVGLLLPNHPSHGQPTYDGGIVPPRLVDTQKCGYAHIYDWTANATSLANWIHAAYERRTSVQPDNSYPHFAYNRSGARRT